MAHMRTAVAALLVVSTALAGCLGGGDDGAAGPGGDGATAMDRWAPDRWRSSLTEPTFEGVVSEVRRVTAEDGTELSLSLHLPAGLGADVQVPTLLQLTPYQSFGAPHTSTPVTGTDPPAGSWMAFVERGAAYVEADVRGTGASEGCLDFGGEADRSDARVLIEWVRAQPWSDGVVVTDGVSHPGMGSVVAHVADPGLAGALAHAPVVSYYQDEWLQGAKFDSQYNSIYQAIELAPPLYDEPAAVASQVALCTGETAFDYGQVDGPFTQLWQDRDLSRYTGDVVAAEDPAPILLTHGFVDLNVHPDHAQLYWDALPDDFPKHMVLGWWYHGWPDLEGHPFGSFEELRHRWLDALLFGVDNGLWQEPRVLVEDADGTWHEGDAWPLEPSTEHTLHAADDGTLTEVPPGEGTTSYVDREGARRGTWEGAHVAFRSEALEAPRLVNGAPTVHLVASSSEAETKWVAYLLDEAPDGSWERITHGYADSHTHPALDGDEAAWAALEPGTPYTWELRLLPTAVVVEPGHRIVLLIASQDPTITDMAADDEACWDDRRGGCYAPSGIVPATTVGRAENTVHVGPNGTTVTFAWVDPEATAKPPWPVLSS